jgi:hypothetical protein
MLARRATLAVAALGALVLGGASAAVGAPAGGAIQLWGTPSLTGNGGGTFVFTGAIAGAAKAAKSNASGKPSKTGQYSVLTFKTGTILVDRRKLNKALNFSNPTTFNSTTCSGSFSASAPLPLVRGTGGYAGISGTVKVKITFAVVLPLTNGKCNPNTSANPVAQFGTISGKGTVRFK